MTTAEKLLVLKRTPPFDRLRDTELILVARAVAVKHYRPGQVVSTDEVPLQRLHLVLDGALVDSSGTALGTIVGAAALLFNRPVDDLNADPTRGATCLVLSRSNLYTTANECPDLMVGLMELWGGAATIS
jgi:signal-transduction protein with cAMP-binding, CBS, and nucleotidyltransferase domain